MDNENWYKWDKKVHDFVLNKDAPDEAKKSYEHYKEQMRYVADKNKRGIII